MIRKNINIYWFSGTGNTLHILQIFTAFLEKQGYSVELAAMENTPEPEINSDKTIGLFFPVALQGTYPVVLDFINRLPDVSGSTEIPGIFMADTLAMYSGGIKGPLKKTLNKKGYKTIGAAEIIMPSNLMRKKENAERKKSIIEKAEKQIIQFAEDLISGKSEWKDIPVFSDLMSSISRSSASWNFVRNHFPMKVDNSTCTRCRICEKNCPTQSWEYDSKNNVMLWNKENCIFCLRCFSYCPEHSISYTNKQFVQNRGVPAGEISRLIK